VIDKYFLNDNFIGEFYVNVNCAEYIKYFEIMIKNRMVVEQSSFNRVDKQVSLNEMLILSADGKQCDLVKEYNNITGTCLKLYSEKYNVLKEQNLNQLFIKIQKTSPGEGFHNFHFENGSDYTSPRVLVSMIYLNDVDEGGETEFLYLSKRIKPEKGKLLIFPAGLTHTHRGNPPLNSPKYIITSWIESLNNSY